METKIRNYNTDRIDVSWDQKRCIHAEECVHNLRKVFDPKQRPWIQPENASVDAVANTTVMCPSGALHYHRKDGGADESTPTENTIHLDHNGPLYIRGDITIVDPDNNVLLEDTRVALCRCGLSQNKPLCDNSHIDGGFEAGITIREEKRKFLEDAVQGGPLRVEPTTNGPLHVTGNFEILDEDGAVMYQGTDTWLCRCGGSSNKPFCDSTHKKNGFVG